MNRKQENTTEPRTRESLVAEIYVREHRGDTSIRAIAKHLGITCDEVRRIYDAHYKEWESQGNSDRSRYYSRYGAGRPVIAFPVGGGTPIYYISARAAGADGFLKAGIYACLNGKTVQYKGYIWKLAKEQS